MLAASMPVDRVNDAPRAADDAARSYLSAEGERGPAMSRKLVDLLRDHARLALRVAWAKARSAEVPAVADRSRKRARPTADRFRGRRGLQTDAARESGRPAIVGPG